MRVHELAVSLLNFFTAVVQGILGLRFVLKLFGANATNNFVDWVYEMSSVLLDPFRGIFPAKVFENRYVLEFSTIFAMFVYALLAVLALALVTAVTPSAEVVVKRKK